MELLIGGVSDLHDPLLAAVVRRHGDPCVALPPANAEALSLGREVAPRGFPTTFYFVLGALLARLRSAALEEPGGAEAVAKRCGYATVFGRFGFHQSDFRHALERAGFGSLELMGWSLSDHRVHAPADIEARWSSAGFLADAIEALVVGDVLRRAKLRRACEVDDPGLLAALVTSTRDSLIHAIEARRPLWPVMDRFGQRLDRIPRTTSTSSANPHRIRVAILGDPAMTIADGTMNGHVVDRLVAAGASVVAFGATEWVLHAGWLLRHADRAAVPAPDAAVLQLARHVESLARRWFRRYAEAAGLPTPHVPDMDELATLAAPHYPADLRGGTSHLEIGAYRWLSNLQAADLVVSIKPFASITSSAVSDGVIHALARAPGAVPFLAVEINGDNEMQIASRVELAFESARSNLLERPRSEDAALVDPPSRG